MTRAFALASLLFAATADATPPRDERAIACESCAMWNRARAPFRVFGNTAYVGVAGLSSVLVTTSDGLVLLDGGLPQSASRIAANIEALGHRLRGVKLILTSHAHYDHVGGVAAVTRRSGARVIGSASTVAALALGRPTDDDPQARSGARSPFPRVTAHAVEDARPITVGDVTFTPHLTPGHTPGSTTWTWRSCEGPRCVDVVYADSLNAVSDDGFRYDPARVEAFVTASTSSRASLATCS